MSYRFPAARIAVFAKAPLPGWVKTRLIPAIGPIGAARLHRQLLERVLKLVVGSEICPVDLYCVPSAAYPVFKQLSRRYGVRLRVQSGRDLGERMKRASAEMLKTASYCLILGSDCVSLSSSDLSEALGALHEGWDAVIGPAEDGGYVLMGLRRGIAGPFAGMQWGGARVLTESRRRMRMGGHRWHELAARWDVDTPKELRRLNSLGIVRSRP